MEQEINTMAGELIIELLAESGWTPTGKMSSFGLAEFVQNGATAYFEVKKVNEVAVFFRAFVSEVRHLFERDGKCQFMAEIGRLLKRCIDAAEAEDD